ncbi:MAG: C-GCAxxG-C-C family protein [Chitinispirillales bacterium]|nr:C-GCAxxG-C-C family protein [Chitinispirillales bacterium]
MRSIWFKYKKSPAIAAGYGGEIAGMRQMCGVINAMIILAGLKFCGEGTDKKRLNETIVTTVSEFQLTASSDNCKILLSKVAGFDDMILLV